MTTRTAGLTWTRKKEQYSVGLWGLLSLKLKQTVSGFAVPAPGRFGQLALIAIYFKILVFSTGQAIKLKFLAGFMEEFI